MPLPCPAPCNAAMVLGLILCSSRAEVRVETWEVRCMCSPRGQLLPPCWQFTPLSILCSHASYRSRYIHSCIHLSAACCLNCTWWWYIYIYIYIVVHACMINHHAWQCGTANGQTVKWQSACSIGPALHRVIAHALCVHSIQVFLSHPSSIPRDLEMGAINIGIHTTF
jgi:hypothetical protein